MLNKIILVLIFSTLIILGDAPAIQGKDSSRSNIEDPNESIRELRRKMMEMQKKTSVMIRQV